MENYKEFRVGPIYERSNCFANSKIAIPNTLFSMKALIDAVVYVHIQSILYTYQALLGHVIYTRKDVIIHSTKVDVLDNIVDFEFHQIKNLNHLFGEICNFAKPFLSDVRRINAAFFGLPKSLDDFIYAVKSNTEHVVGEPSRQKNPTEVSIEMETAAKYLHRINFVERNWRRCKDVDGVYFTSHYLDFRNLTDMKSNVYFKKIISYREVEINYLPLQIHYGDK
uniref:P26 n=1 Tax=Parastrongyloides trichosuri TaxID=131310 RepID=A0A0N5A123_PARTI